MANESNANPNAGVTGKVSGLTILVADDEAGIRHLVGQILRSYGYTVLEAADGVEALEVAEQHPGPIHLLLTDWCMPRLDGGGLIRSLSNGHPETAILVMSGYINIESPSKAAVLRKPFNSQDLVDSVNEVLLGQRLSREAQAGSELVHTVEASASACVCSSKATRM